MRTIPFGKPNVGENETANVLECLRSGQLTLNGWVHKFEEQFAAYIGVRHAVATTSGTTALHLALAAWGITRGDEVIVPALTFVATANAVSYTGALSTIVDVDAKTWCIDPKEVEKAIKPGKTKAIIPVHLYGVPAPMAELKALADKYGLLLLEDAAEALGAETRDSWNTHTFLTKVGSIGHMGCFSFYGNKTITTGEGGMVVTNDDKLAERLRLLRGHAQGSKRYWHIAVGYNYRMTDVQAAIGCAQMERLEMNLLRRYQVAAAYKKQLPDLVTFQELREPDIHGYWATAALFREQERDDFILRRGFTWITDKLTQKYGIETRPVFPPLNHFPMYSKSGHVCPVAADISERGVVFPTYPDLTDDDVTYVCDSLKEILNAERST